MSDRQPKTPSCYNFVIAQGRIIVGFGYRGRIITAPVSVIIGGIAHGRHVYTKDERKRIKKEPKDASLIASSNGRVETMPCARNFLSRPWHEKKFGKPAFDLWWFKNSASDELGE